MISSGIKRGLAASAISALTVTGIPFIASTASAVTLNSSVATATAVVVTAPDTGTASTKNDGQNTSIRLEAIGGADIAQVRFEYSIGAGAYTTIDTVSRNDNGAFSTEWPAAGLDGATVNLRAVGLASGGAATTTTAPDTVQISASAVSVNVSDGPVAAVFQKPDYDGAAGTDGPGGADDTERQNVIVSGTSSSTTSAPSLAFWDPSAQAYVNGGTAASTTATGATTGTFRGVLDITGYDYGATDELLVKATDVTDDAEAFSLEKQVITTVSATADRTTVPAGTPANVTVTVNDQSGRPIAGAEVRNSNGILIGQTNAFGRVSASQGNGATYYYANATASNPYEANLGDKQSETITVTEYNPVPTTLVASSADQTVFDFDEYGSGDIAVQVKDQNSNDLDTTGQTVSYHWTVTPFGGGNSVRFPATGESTQPVDANGRFVVEFPSGGPSGTYQLVAALGANALGNGAIAASTLLTVKAGDSNIVFDQYSPEQATAGTQEVVAGKLVLPDGTGLPGRLVDVTYSSGGNAGIVQANGTSGPSRQVTTGADGAFSVTVKDVAETTGNPPTQPTENGTVDATTANTPGIGNAQEGNSATVQFLASVAPTSVTVVDNNAAADTPGVANAFRVHLENASGPLTNQTVTLTVDHGFFTDGTPDPAAAVGADAGELKSLGTSVPVTTDGNGNATVLVAIERDAGFDDDGQVVARITATAGSASDSEVQQWDSSNPLNGGTVSVEQSDGQTVGVLPKAPTNEDVFYDVFATDQFGNLVGGETVAVSDNLAGATVNGDEGSAGDLGSASSGFEGSGPELTLGSGVAGNQTPTVTWTAPTTRYSAVTPAVTTANGTETLTDSGETVQWYVINYATSSYRLAHDTANTVPVGSTVIETYTAIDQNGEPIRGQEVQFFRSGPDTLQDGTPATNTFTFQTGEDGKATYVFSGATAGTATIQALITDSNGADELADHVVGGSRATDTVTFGSGTTPPPTTPPTTPTTPPAVIDISLSGSSRGQKDKVKVDGPFEAAGAAVTLYKKVRGKLVAIASKTLDSKGNKRFKVADVNGDAVTKYVVKVTATAKTQADEDRINVK